jgi:hypothetical protein
MRVLLFSMAGASSRLTLRGSSSDSCGWRDRGSGHLLSPRSGCSLRRFAVRTAATKQTPTGDLRSLLPRFFAANDVTVSAGIGLYLALGGGILILLTGLFALVRSRRRITGDASGVGVPTELEEGVSASSSRSDEVKQGDAIDAPVELDQVTDAPMDEQPKSPVREAPEPVADVVEAPPATSDEQGPASPEASTAPEEAPPEEPSAREERSPDEWSF